MMENGANEKRLMLKTFKFVKKVSNLKYGNTFILKCIILISFGVVLKFNIFLVNICRREVHFRGRFLQRLIPLEVSM
jgi:hypothetical protein